MLNVILLLVNLVALLMALGERASIDPGGLSWLGTLDWRQLSQQIWTVTQSEQVASVTVMAAWLSFSVLWVSATAIDFFIRRKKASGIVAMQASRDDEAAPTLVGANAPVGQRAQGSQAPADAAAFSRSAATANATGFAGAMASAQAAQATDSGIGGRSANLADPTLGPLFNDLERQVSNLPAEAQQEIDQLRRALEALVAKP